ncbi:hypothetical protein KSP39_PZI006147 [Platanthera zijinensis]|uniref:Trichome birefringence-like N-terminal domain-containing protein n=1 Tax=Platanthera zijinensis TaxID=2320716 RepID=A0AAP0GAL8_9ASPA
MAFSYYLFHSNSPNSDVPSCHAADDRKPEDSTWRDSYIQLPGVSFNVEGKCDLFSGKWVCNPSGSPYTNLSCNFIETPQNCMRNGRPDTEYLYWRWKPYGCELPPFDPSKFFNAMKDKSWAFIGDSIFRNHIQSILCLLSKVETPVEIYHDETFKSRTWYFSEHNFTVAVIWSPFLVKSEISEDDKGKSASEVQLHVDVPEEKWTLQYNKYDYIIFSGGQWFLKTMVVWDNSIIVGCHNCKNRSLKELGIYYPYRKVLQSVYKFMLSSDHKPLVFFRTWTPDHFEYGEWFNGGICNRTRPYREGQYKGKPIDPVMRNIEIKEFKKAVATKSRGGARLKLLDTFHLSLLRPDGHPGPYRTFHPFDKDKNARVQNDCLHWCLPGPIDTWNELIMKILIDEGDVSYS